MATSVFHLYCCTRKLSTGIPIAMWAALGMRSTFRLGFIISTYQLVDFFLKRYGTYLDCMLRMSVDPAAGTAESF